jgi:hypothetical protein
MPFPRGTLHYQSQGFIRGSQEVLRSSVLHGRTPLETGRVDTGLVTLSGRMVFVRPWVSPRITAVVRHYTRFLS